MTLAATATVTIRANFKLPGATGYKTEIVTVAASASADLMQQMHDENNAAKAALEAKHGAGIIHGEATWIG